MSYQHNSFRTFNITMNSFKFFIALVVLAMAFASNKKTETKTVAAKSSSSSSKSVAMKSAKGASALNTMDEDALSFIQVRIYPMISSPSLPS